MSASRVISEDWQIRLLLPLPPPPVAAVVASSSSIQLDVLFVRCSLLDPLKLAFSLRFVALARSTKRPLVAAAALFISISSISLTASTATRRHSTLSLSLSIRDSPALSIFFFCVCRWCSLIHSYYLSSLSSSSSSSLLPFIPCRITTKMINGEGERTDRIVVDAIGVEEWVFHQDRSGQGPKRPCWENLRNIQGRSLRVKCDCNRVYGYVCGMRYSQIPAARVGIEKRWLGIHSDQRCGGILSLAHTPSKPNCAHPSRPSQTKRLFPDTLRQRR